jgi:hypothetical protein
MSCNTAGRRVRASVAGTRPRAIIARLLAAVAGAGLLAASPAPAALGSTVSARCYAPAADPAPGTAAWQARDALNMYCATLRLRDQYRNPAFTFALDSQTPGVYAAQAQEQAGDGPGHLHGGIYTLVPGLQVADPFRTLSRWTAAGLGRVAQVAFTAADGAQLRGHVFEPPASAPPPPGGYPGVVITDGSLQAFENLYYWAAEDLVAHGYMVMTYDPQGQGDSDLFPAGCPDASNPSGATGCKGVPFQQSYNFFQGAEDSLSFFLATPAHPSGGGYNPFWASLNPDAVGVAGHSLGASAVSEVGQCDDRVKAIVAWDDLTPVSACNSAGETIPAQYRSATLLRVPAMTVTPDYFFTPQAQSSVPNPHSGGLNGDSGYQQLAKAGLDTMKVSLRGTTHLEFTYIPYIQAGGLPASELGERIASYYTVAWFDRYLKGDASAFQRLVATTFDGSADGDSIGAGTYSVAAARANPSDPTAGNVAYHIAGMPVADVQSLYYYSEYALHDPATGALVSCGDMRAGCPAKTPVTP